MKTFILAIVILSISISFAQNTTENNSNEIWFLNGFEHPTEVVPNCSGSCDPITDNYNHTLINNGDNSSPYLSNWDTELINNHDLGNFKSFAIGHNGFSAPIVGGNATQRNAEIVDDPENTSNKVLYTWANEAYMDRGSFFTARVQPSMSNNNIESWSLDGTGFEELHYSVKFYLPNSFQDILDDNSYHLQAGDLTFAQFLNDATWANSDGHWQINVVIQEQINFGLVHSLNFTIIVIDRMTGMTYEVYEDKLRNIPIGQWNTVDYYFKEGDVDTGKFRIKLNGVIVFDLTMPTHRPGATSPDGLTHFDPMDLYLHERIINFFNPTTTSVDERVEIFWDDFTIYEDSKLKKKFIKVVSPSSGSVITNNNLTLSANWLPGTIPGVGLPDDWKYIFWIANRDDPNNIIYTPGQKSRTLDLTPYKLSGELRNNARYRVFTAIRNHPFINQFGAWPNYHMDFTTNFNTIGIGRNRDEEIVNDSNLMLSPNPATNDLNITFTVKDSNVSTKVYLVNKSNQLIEVVLEEKLEVGSYNRPLDITKLNTDIYFIVLENGINKEVKTLSKE